MIKNNYEEKIKELEDRISRLEQRPVYVPVYPCYPPVGTGRPYPMQDPFYGPTCTNTTGT